MDVAALSSSLTTDVFTSSKQTSQTTGVGGGDRDGDGATRRAHHSGGRHAFMQSVQQALAALGVSTSAPARSASGATSTDADGDADTDANGARGSNPSGQAVHALLHDLFQALRATQNTPSAAGAPPSTTVSPWASGDVSTGLQNLVSELGAGGLSSNPSLAKLQTDFTALVGGATTADGSTPTLAGFLQTLQQGLSGVTAATAAVGGTVNASA